MSMMQFDKPIPVIVEDGKEGYAIYVTDSGAFENDMWCVTLCTSGIIRHYRSDQIRLHHNETLGIIKGTRTCPDCKENLVQPDGYCPGRCRQTTMKPI